MKPDNVLYLLTILILLSFSSLVYAHKVNVFAWAEQDIIFVESSFSGGRKMVRGTITVHREDTGETVVSGKTDKDGHFSFKISKTITEHKPILKIIANGGDGHQAFWKMVPEDYLGASETSPSAQLSKGSFPPASRQVTESVGVSSDVNMEQLERILEAKLGPIRRDIASLSDPAPSIQEIIGAIGYLVGIAGIVAWIKSRRGKI